MKIKNPAFKTDAELFRDQHQVLIRDLQLALQEPEGNPEFIDFAAIRAQVPSEISEALTDALLQSLCELLGYEVVA